MNWDRIEGNWKEVRGKVKEKWAKLTDDDLTEINGKRDQLEGRLDRHGGENHVVEIISDSGGRRPQRLQIYSHFHGSGSIAAFSFSMRASTIILTRFSNVV